VLNGRATLPVPTNVLVKGKNVIDKISGSPIPVGRANVLIEGDGRTLIPGFRRSRPLNVCGNPAARGHYADVGYLHQVAGRAQRTFMRGFTTVRDVGGPTLGLKKSR